MAERRILKDVRFFSLLTHADKRVCDVIWPQGFHDGWFLISHLSVAEVKVVFFVKYFLMNTLFRNSTFARSFYNDTLVRNK